MHVMVIDDSIPVRERMVQMISDLDEVAEVSQASDTTSAIRLLENASPDLLVMDLRMPGGGGVEMLYYLRRRAMKLVTVILTNFPYLQLRTKCLELGADYFLDKSTDFEQILDIIAEVHSRFQEKSVSVESVCQGGIA